MKRFLYLFIIIAAIVLVTLVGYYLRYTARAPQATPEEIGGLPGAPNQSNSPQNKNQAETTQTAQPSGLPPVSGKFGLVAQNQAVNFFVDQENNVIIVQPDGQIVKVVKGEVTTLGSSVITDLISAEFSYDGKKILATFGDPSTPQGSVFNIATKLWQPLTASFASAVWSPTNYQIAYLKESADYKSLFLLDASNAKSKPQEIKKLRVQDVDLSWVKPNQILLIEKASADITSSIWSFDLKLKKLALILEGLGQESIWSKTANIGLAFAATRSKRGGALSLVDTAGNTLTRLKITTLPSKCVFGNEVLNSPSTPTSATSSSSKPGAAETLDVLYCAVPRNATRFSGVKLPDDYAKKAVFTADDIYKVGLSKGNAAPIFNDENQNADVSNPKVFNQNLFFINRYDQKIYAVSLKSS